MPQENESKRILELPGHASENVKTTSEVPQPSTEFRMVPKDAEDFGKVPQLAERKEVGLLRIDGRRIGSTMKPQAHDTNLR